MMVVTVSSTMSVVQPGLLGLKASLQPNSHTTTAAGESRGNQSLMKILGTITKPPSRSFLSGRSVCPLFVEAFDRLQKPNFAGVDPAGRFVECDFPGE
jgi:hypothetical protein